MCVNCMNGGFHQEQTIDEQKSLSDGLVDRDWFNYAAQTGVRDDGKFTFYMSDDLPKKVRGFVRRTIKKIDKVTQYPIKKTNTEDKADVLVDDVTNYDNWGPIYSNAAGLAYFDYNNNSKLNATWLTSVQEFNVTKKGKIKLSNNAKRIITHEILHTLGLQHPYGQGSYLGVDNSDTAMSYNIYHWDLKDPLRSADIEALQSLWGYPHWV